MLSKALGLPPVAVEPPKAGKEPEGIAVSFRVSFSLPDGRDFLLIDDGFLHAVGEVAFVSIGFVKGDQDILVLSLIVFDGREIEFCGFDMGAHGCGLPCRSWGVLYYGSVIVGVLGVVDDAFGLATVFKTLAESGQDPPIEFYAREWRKCGFDRSPVQFMLEEKSIIFQLDNLCLEAGG